MNQLTPLMILVYAAALPPMCIGAWLLAYRANREVPDAPTTSEQQDPQGPWARLAEWRRTAAAPTRQVVGLSLALIAYHAAAYVSPDAWFGFKVPLERWYILVGAIVVAIVCTFISETLESKRGM